MEINGTEADIFLRAFSSAGPAFEENGLPLLSAASPLFFRKKNRPAF